MPRVRVRLLDSANDECIATVEWQIDGNPAQQLESRLIRLFDSDLIGRDRLIDLLRTNPEWPNLQRQRDAILSADVRRRPPAAVPPVAISGSEARQCLTAVREVINRIGIKTIGATEAEQKPARYRDALEALEERLARAENEMTQRNSAIQAALAQAGKPSTNWQTHLAQIDALHAEYEQALAEQKRLERELNLWRGQYDNVRDHLDSLQNQLLECDDERRELQQQLETARHENQQWPEVRQGSADDALARPRGPI